MPRNQRSYTRIAEGMNLLLHQDYSDHARKAVIKFFRDGIQFC